MDPGCSEVLLAYLNAPVDGERNDDETASPEDVAAIGELDPPPTTVEDARQRLGWRKQRASNALRAWREQQQIDVLRVDTNSSGR